MVKIHTERSDLMKKLILGILIIGGLNWGLIGFFKYNLVDSIFGPDFFWVSRIIYALVGLSAIWSISFLFKNSTREG
jgi:hypothetical protein